MRTYFLSDTTTTQFNGWITDHSRGKYRKDFHLKVIYSSGVKNKTPIPEQKVSSHRVFRALENVPVLNFQTFTLGDHSIQEVPRVDSDGTWGAEREFPSVPWTPVEKDDGHTGGVILFLPRISLYSEEVTKLNRPSDTQVRGEFKSVAG